MIENSEIFSLPVRCVIALGSNIPDRLFHINKALELWRNDEAIKIVRVSEIYETDPVGENLTGKFLNAVFACDVSLSPFDLLNRCHEIEKQCGRRRADENPDISRDRTIDCDIIFYGDETISTPSLKIPHPRWRERLFVVLPLRDIFDTLTDRQKKQINL